MQHILTGRNGCLAELHAKLCGSGVDAPLSKVNAGLRSLLRSSRRGEGLVCRTGMSSEGRRKGYLLLACLTLLIELRILMLGRSLRMRR